MRTTKTVMVMATWKEVCNFQIWTPQLNISLTAALAAKINCRMLKAKCICKILACVYSFYCLFQSFLHMHMFLFTWYSRHTEPLSLRRPQVENKCVFSLVSCGLVSSLCFRLRLCRRHAMWQTIDRFTCDNYMQIMAKNTLLLALRTVESVKFVTMTLRTKRKICFESGVCLCGTNVLYWNWNCARQLHWNLIPRQKTSPSISGHLALGPTSQNYLRFQLLN